MSISCPLSIAPVHLSMVFVNYKVDIPVINPNCNGLRLLL